MQLSLQDATLKKILRRNLNHKKKTLWIQVPMLLCIPIWIFQRFPPYKYAMGNGNVTAEIISDMLDTDSPQLTVTVQNHTDKTEEWKVPESYRLEKKINGEWYYHDKEISEVPAVCSVLPAGTSITDTYTFVKLPENGTYRILYLFRGNWCSVEFEI